MSKFDFKVWLKIFGKNKKLSNLISQFPSLKYACNVRFNIIYELYLIANKLHVNYTI